MRIFWEDSYIEKPLGSKLKGLARQAKRPIKIQVTASEMEEFMWTYPEQRLVEYMNTTVLRALRRTNGFVEYLWDK